MRKLAAFLWALAACQEFFIMLASVEHLVDS